MASRHLARRALWGALGDPRARALAPLAATPPDAGRDEPPRRSPAQVPSVAGRGPLSSRDGVPGPRPASQAPAPPPRRPGAGARRPPPMPAAPPGTPRAPVAPPGTPRAPAGPPGPGRPGARRYGSRPVTPEEAAGWAVRERRRAPSPAPAPAPPGAPGRGGAAPGSPPLEASPAFGRVRRALLTRPPPPPPGASAAEEWEREAARGGDGPPGDGSAWFVAGPRYEGSGDAAGALASLSAEQREPASAPPGTVMVTAGPGSGKTRVLTARVAHLLGPLGAQPWQVLAVTFTNKAARELRERVGHVVGFDSGNITASTFHSFCVRLLRRHLGSLPGVFPGRGGDPAAFTILDEDDSRAVLRRVVEEEARRDPGLLRARVSRNARGAERVESVGGEDVATYVRRVRGLFSSAKQYVSVVAAGDVGFAEAYERARERSAEAEVPLPPLRGGPPDDLEALWRAYHGSLRAAGAFDFDDLLGVAVHLLRTRPDVLADVRRRYRHVLVDEFQDTNGLQYTLLRLVAPGAAAAGDPPPGDAAADRSLFVVGDVDQSVYSWRGADVGNMQRRFARDYPGMRHFRLRDNYRSSAQVVAASEAIIAAPGAGEARGFRAVDARAGPTPRVVRFPDEGAEVGPRPRAPGPRASRPGPLSSCTGPGVRAPPRAPGTRPPAPCDGGPPPPARADGGDRGHGDGAVPVDPRPGPRDRPRDGPHAAGDGAAGPRDRRPAPPRGRRRVPRPGQPGAPAAREGDAGGATPVRGGGRAPLLAAGR